MKGINKVCQILAIVTGVAVLALFFFTGFAAIVSSETTTLSGAQLAFGGAVELGDNSFKMAKSADIWFCLILTILGVLFSALTFKFKGMRFASPAVSVVAAIYMLVIVLSAPAKFVDTRPIPDYATITDINYLLPAIIITVLLFVTTIAGVAHLLIADKLEVAGTKKPTLLRRVITFFRDYKSEVKKIAWPNFKFVVKNTFVVLVICAIIGAFIWLLDWGLGELLGLILGV